jgi:ABC-type multidrug transport system ATPase subunit
LIAAANVSENRFGSSGSATILLTTQYLEEADQLADEIAVIDHGRVIAEGTGNELKDRVGGQILEVERRRLRVRPQLDLRLRLSGRSRCRDRSRVDRRNRGSLRPALRLALPADELTQSGGSAFRDRQLIHAVSAEWRWFCRDKTPIAP